MMNIDGCLIVFQHGCLEIDAWMLRDRCLLRMVIWTRIM